MRIALGMMALVLSAGFSAKAAPVESSAILMSNVAELQQAAMVDAKLLGLKWKINDKANYSMDIGGFIKGTINSFVREETATGFWVQQDADMGFLGKQKIEILFNKNTGAVEKILANGQEQKAPDQKDMELVETKEDRITVKAGTFDAIYVKIKDKKSGDIQEAWVNPKEVPISGMLKVIAPSQMGKMNQELTSFEFGR